MANLNRQRNLLSVFKNKKLYISSLILSIIIALIPSLFFSNLKIERNANSDFCEYIAHVSINKPSPDRIDRTYIKTDNRYELYNPSKNITAEKYYTKFSGAKLNLEDANWQSQGEMCRLKTRAYILPFIFLLTFIAYIFPISLLIVFVIIFTKKSSKN